MTTFTEPQLIYYQLPEKSVDQVMKVIEDEIKEEKRYNFATKQETNMRLLAIERLKEKIEKL